MILERFIDANESQLFALTARDAVVGSVQGSAYAISSAARLLDVRQLTKLIERLRTDSDGCRDDVLIAGMIELARKTGDVTRVPISFPPMTVAMPSFWTSLFVGNYLLRDVKFPGLVSTEG